MLSLDDAREVKPSLVGGKGFNLGRLRRAGLPVPDGFCVTTDVYDLYIQTGTLPSDLVSYFANIKSQLGGKVAVRSSANCEDGDQLSMAGVFQSFYVEENDDIKRTIEMIYSHARSSEVVEFMTLHGLKPSEIKMGLVIQRLINPERAGVIYTGVNGGNVLIQYVDGYFPKNHSRRITPGVD